MVRENKSYIWSFSTGEPKLEYWSFVITIIIIFGSKHMFVQLFELKQLNKKPKKQFQQYIRVYILIISKHS